MIYSLSGYILAKFKKIINLIPQCCGCQSGVVVSTATRITFAALTSGIYNTPPPEFLSLLFLSLSDTKLKLCRRYA